MRSMNWVDLSVSERLNQTHNMEVVITLGPSTKIRKICRQIIYVYTQNIYKQTDQAFGPRGKFFLEEKKMHNYKQSSAQRLNLVRNPG